MNVETAELATFRLTGRRAGADTEDDSDGRLRPALFASYGDLSRLRYDYPLILTEGGADACVRSLSSVIDELLQDISPRGMGGERIRRHLLNLERAIRARAAGGASGTLKALWDDAAADLLARADEPTRESLQDSIDRGRAALALDGEVVDCDDETLGRVVRHLWTAAQDEKAQAFRVRVDGLARRLTEILQADFMRSPEARTPDSLKASVGTAFEQDFDFAALSRVLSGAATGDSLSETRRSRIRAALAVLENQRFFAAASEEGGPKVHGFVFDRCTDAVAAFRARLPEMAEVVKAMLIAELETANRYRDAKHDPFFAEFDGDALAADDVEPFPDYLVCRRAGQDEPGETTALIEILSSDLPIKVLVQSDDILARPGPALGQLPFDAGGPPLARMAIGLGGAYVMQAAGSHLYRVRDWLARGLAWSGPSLFSLYSGASANDGGSTYLAAAAAMESRAFPAFAYDPGAGADWASRFHIADNPQPEADWPAHGFAYEDETHQRVAEDISFTAADFIASDPRYRNHLAAVPAAAWHQNMVPVAVYLDLEATEADDKIPYVLMIDDRDALHRVVLDDRLVDAARRCRAAWRALQELGGIHNSHAERLLAREKAAWEQEKEQEIEALKRFPPPEAAPATAPQPAAPQPAAEAAPAAPEEVEEPAAPVDEAYIETPRCTTCNECTEINGRMFAYNENKQAFIADPDAGTFRQLVEAAENCQVSIIHPGKPRNPDEPGLDELIARAEPFN